MVNWLVLPLKLMGALSKTIFLMSEVVLKVSGGGREYIFRIKSIALWLNAALMFPLFQFSNKTPLADAEMVEHEKLLAVQFLTTTESTLAVIFPVEKLPAVQLLNWNRALPHEIPPLAAKWSSRPCIHQKRYPMQQWLYPLPETTLCPVFILKLDVVERLLLQ